MRLRLRNSFIKKIDQLPPLYLVIISAILLALSRLPIHLGFLAFFALVPLFFFFRRNLSVKQLIFSGYIFAVFYNTISLHWISLVTIPGFIGTYFLFGTYFSILFFLIFQVTRKLPKFRYLIITTFWISFELVQNFGEFRFPWMNLAYSLEEYLFMIQFAEIGGIYLLSLFIIIINIFIYKSLIQKFNPIYIIIFILLWTSIGFFRYKTIKLEQTDKNISMIQASIPQEKKWEATYLDTTVTIYSELTCKAALENSDLIIWPESAIPVYLAKSYQYRHTVLNLARKINTDIYVAFPDYERAPDDFPEKYYFYNSSTLFSKKGTLSKLYRKNFLVPFGERFPFLNIFPIIRKIDFGQANFEYGKDPEFYNLDSLRYSPLICFEIAFPYLTNKISKNNTDFIINMTNDAWFKRSIGTYQHSILTKFRAIETRKQIYRAANTGYSLVVSPTGKILKKSELFARTIISENLYLYDKETIYTKYLYFFPYVFLFCSILFIVIYFIKLRFK